MPKHAATNATVTDSRGSHSDYEPAVISPGISDRPEQPEEHFLEQLALDWPEDLERYERLYRGRAYLGKEETKPVLAAVAELAKEYGIKGPPPRSA
jgi:hypothetical protein